MTKIAFMASDAIALDSIRAVHAGADSELVCVVSNPDKPKGRGKKLSPNDVSAWALENGVELLRPEKTPDDSVCERLRQLGTELIVVMAYGRILRKNVLEFGKFPCLNLHASLLPDLRGASPVESAIALGYEKTGVSLMAIEPEMDAGAVCAEIEVPIAASDDSASLRAKIGAAAAKLLTDNLAAIVGGTAKFVPQNSALATYTRKFTPDDRLADFSLSARELANRVRAFSFAVAELDGERIKLADARAEKASRENDVCGRVVAASKSDGLRIACKGSDIVFDFIQKPCAKMLACADFFTGNSIEVGKIFSSVPSLPILK